METKSESENQKETNQKKQTDNSKSNNNDSSFFDIFDNPIVKEAIRFLVSSGVTLTATHYLFIQPIEKKIEKMEDKREEQNKLIQSLKEDNIKLKMQNEIFEKNLADFKQALTESNNQSVRYQNGNFLNDGMFERKRKN